MNNTYMERSFPFSKYFIKVIIIILVVFLLVWLFTKSSHKKNSSQEQIDYKYIIKETKKKALKYYNQSKVNSLSTQEDKISLKKINPKNEEKFKKFNQKKSYIKLKKENNIYSMTISILCNKKRIKETIYLEHTNYCKTYLCEIKQKEENEEKNHNTENESIQDNNLDTKNSNHLITKRKVIKPVNTGSISIVDTTNHNYVYQYVKANSIKYSPWSNWYYTGEVMCNQPNAFCTDSSICLKEEKIVKSLESENTKKNSQNKISIQEVGSKVIMGCSNYHYISFNNTLYQANLDYSNLQNWKYEGRYQFQMPPKDNLYTKYLYVNINNSNNHTNLYKPEKYYFDKYTFSNISLANLNCPYKSYKTVKNYSYHSSSIVYVKEEMVDGRCYKMIRNRTIRNDNDFIWSSYNNQTLLQKGYQYTGKKELIS